MSITNIDLELTAGRKSIGDIYINGPPGRTDPANLDVYRHGERIQHWVQVMTAANRTWQYVRLVRMNRFSVWMENPAVFPLADD